MDYSPLINVTSLQKDKLWCVYFGLIPRLSWPMQIYEVSKLKLPMKSLIEEFDSMDPLVQNGQPTIITNWKLDAKYAVEMAESSLKMKRVIDLVVTGRAGLGLHPQQSRSKETAKNK